VRLWGREVCGRFRGVGGEAGWVWVGLTGSRGLEMVLVWLWGLWPFGQWVGAGRNRYGRAGEWPFPCVRCVWAVASGLLDRGVAFFAALRCGL